MTQQEFKRILDRAFKYGSDYWYEADSESYRLNIKSEETRRKYEEFIETSYKHLALCELCSMKLNNGTENG